MDIQEFSAELSKVSPKNGDIIFVDENAVNLDDIAELISPDAAQDNVLFIAVRVPQGKSVRDVVFSMTAGEMESYVAQSIFCPIVVDTSLIDLDEVRKRATRIAPSFGPLVLAVCFCLFALAAYLLHP